MPHLTLKYECRVIATSWRVLEFDAFKDVMQVYITREHQQCVDENDIETLAEKRDTIREVYLLVLGKQTNPVQAFNELNTDYIIEANSAPESFAPFIEKLQVMEKLCTCAFNHQQTKLKDDVRKLRAENESMRDEIKGLYKEVKRLKSC